ncbi:hypothetical protein CCR75_007017 [Bremia lactucae]|uniref:Uncharacterized protein n=1 Tax=Bremia lactucae TaxID=4779 RepID=A0A976FH97_BRELC|nr:hypothetical protein CCR75_007015 [Bremia lactucae]TDH66504.1 hypothetical protein CCR75_007017 [Bremia lactucae]
MEITSQLMANMWTQYAAEQSAKTGSQDVDMSADPTSSYKFKSSVYTPEVSQEVRRQCQTPFGFPTQLRKPTAAETKNIKGLVKGSILCAKLLEFLKRICTNESLRLIQILSILKSKAP